MARIVEFIPIILLLCFVGGFAWVGYQMYLYSQQLADRGKSHLAKKNISYSKDGGVKVGVKEMSAEEYSSKTQNAIVNAWNLSSWPAYKSRFWNKDAQGQPASASGSAASDKRPASSRQSSSTKTT